MSARRQRPEIRNIAIVAHVDHGKTTLVDQFFRQSGGMGAQESQTDRAMDSNPLERERGITILAKNTGITWGDYSINIVDTPGHSDFGGEVERTLQMVEGFLLLVDAAEGVLPGTRFVLQKALRLKLRPIVLINKIDRRDADIERTRESINDLFLDLAQHEDQLNFPLLYGSSRLGFAGYDPLARTGSLEPLFRAIVDYIPAPVEHAEALQFLVTNLDHSDFLGPIAIGRVFSGTLMVGQQVIQCRDAMVSKPIKLTKIFKFAGLSRIECESASFGDIVAIAGFDTPPAIGTTICELNKPLPYVYVTVDEPTVSIYVSVNDSPFNGREGSLLTSRQIKERLERELRTNVALRVEPTSSPESFKVSGRGQMHLGVLVENMRREGFEVQISAPEVIYKDIDGVRCEPIEWVVIDIPEEYQGALMENLGRRKARMKHMTAYENGRIRLEYEIASRALLGFRSQFMTDTRGTGHATFLIQVNNLNILTDPVFGDLHSILYPRMTAPGIPPELLPPIDIVLISHNHRDHLDESSIQKLKAHDPLFLVPAGTAKWFSERGITRVVEHQWWQKTRVNSNNRAIDLTFVPARHWSGRNLTDLHSSLWGGWTLQTNDASLYFAGDTAFDAELFAAIATHLERRPLCALLPIGPCEPRALMCHSHMGPEEVPAACAILKPLSCVPMHWGTFRLGPDAFDAPIQRLRTAWERQLHTIGTCNLRPMKLGERFSIHSINS